MPRLDHLLSILGKDERGLPLVVDYLNYNGFTAHIKLKETGSVQDVAKDICKSYGDCDVKYFRIDDDDVINIIIHRKKGKK